MDFLSSFVEWLGPARYVFGALVTTGVLIALLLVFILARRAVRRRYLEKRDRRTLAIRQQWLDIIQMRISPEQWRFDRMDREIVESTLTDQLEVATLEDAELLTHLLRSTGLVDMRAS